jgi:hypothetical protein
LIDYQTIKPYDSGQGHRAVPQITSEKRRYRKQVKSIRLASASHHVYFTQDGDLRKRCDMESLAKPMAEGQMPPKLEDQSDTERVQIVAPASWIRRIEEWRRAQPKIPSRSDAIRQLVELGLKVKK